MAPVATPVSRTSLCPNVPFALFLREGPWGSVLEVGLKQKMLNIEVIEKVIVYIPESSIQCRPELLDE